MELIEELEGSRVFIDTSPFIYFMEGHHTSTFTLLEVLVQPFRKGDEVLADRYKEILLNSRGLTTFIL